MAKIAEAWAIGRIEARQAVRWAFAQAYEKSKWEIAARNAEVALTAQGPIKEKPTA